MPENRNAVNLSALRLFTRRHFENCFSKYIFDLSRLRVNEMAQW